jgi:hypothetical protein
MSFILLNDPASQQQRLIRNDHISAVELSKADEIVTLYLLGGKELRLTREESKQFVRHVKEHMHPVGSA